MNALTVLACALVIPGLPADELLGYWPLRGSARDVSGNGRHATDHDVDWTSVGRDGGVGGAAGLNGTSAQLEVPNLRLGTRDFSIAVWANADHLVDDVPGDLVSQYDVARRRGFHLSLKSNYGVTFSQANDRQLQFGIDNDQTPPEWTDCGRPGNALLAFALAVHDGQLYAGTCEPAKDAAGHVYRYDGAGQWTDCGTLDQSNAVTTLAVFEGRLYAGTGKYRTGGSALPDSENLRLGGRVLRYDGGTKWTDCGQIPDAEAVGGLVIFRGRLYASSLYKPAGFFRYEGGDRWTSCGTPDGKRVEAMAVFNGHLYATSYDEGSVFRYDGRDWTHCGHLADNTQTYGFAVHHGKLHVGTWRSGRVYRFEGGTRWTDTGRLGDELEVMGMLVHNGRLIAGTLPLAQVFESRGDNAWQRLTQLDETPSVTYRRAWTMAEFQGRVFASTLPSGRVYSWQAGRLATCDRSLSPGWHHIAAVKARGRLRLYLDGRRIAESDEFEPAAYNLDSPQPLRIGSGANDFFRGRLAELRVFCRALTDDEVQKLCVP